MLIWTELSHYFDNGRKSNDQCVCFFDTEVARKCKEEKVPFNNFIWLKMSVWKQINENKLLIKF